MSADVLAEGVIIDPPALEGKRVQIIYKPVDERAIHGGTWFIRYRAAAGNLDAHQADYLVRRQRLLRRLRRRRARDDA
jgi:hypothetical protein